MVNSCFLYLVVDQELVDGPFVAVAARLYHRHHALQAGRPLRAPLGITHLWRGEKERVEWKKKKDIGNGK